MALVRKVGVTFAIICTSLGYRNLEGCPLFPKLDGIKMNSAHPHIQTKRLFASSSSSWGPRFRGLVGSV